MDEIKFEARFKKVNLFNNTLHIILYPKDGLRTAVKLQELEEGSRLVFSLKESKEKVFNQQL